MGKVWTPTDIAVLELGCGVSGAVSGRHLAHLGATVTHLCSDEPCDLWQPLFAHLMHGKGRAIGQRREPADALLQGLQRPDVVVWGGPVPGLEVSHLERFWPATITLVLSSTGRDEVIDDWANGARAEAASGVLGTTGFADQGPVPLGFLFSEVYGGIRGAAAVLERLYESGGEGQNNRVIDLSLVDCCIEAMENPFQELAFGGRAFPLAGNHRGGMMPYGLYEGRDGYVGLVAASGAWPTFAAKMGRPELGQDPRLATVQGRLEQRDMLLPIIEEWVRNLPSVDSVVDIIGDDAIAARVLDLSEVPAYLPELFERNHEGLLIPASPYQWERFAP